MSFVLLPSSSNDNAAVPPAADAALRLGRSMGLRVMGASLHRREARALLVSLLVHALFLSLTFGGQGVGLPGFGLPWQDRRAEVPEALRVLLDPAPAAPLPPPAPMAEAQTPAAALAEPNAAPAPDRQLAATPPPATPDNSIATPPETAPAAPGPLSWRADTPGDTALLPSAAGPAVIALPRADEARWAVAAATVLAPVAPPPAPVIAAAALPSASSPQPVALAAAPVQRPDPGAAMRARADLRAWERALEQQQQQQQQQQQAEFERARQQAEQLAQAQQEAARAEAARHEAARLEAARAESARQEAERQEAARQAAARQEAATQETARQEAARQEAARVEEAVRQEAERHELARQAAAQAARQEAARGEAAKLAQAQAQTEAEQREARLRAIGRQLNEEADRRDAAARQSAALPPSASSARRGRLFGRSDANAELVLYAEAWARKLQLNMGFDLVRDAVKQPHNDPMVTVAIRSDGSVESVSFVRSSGVPAIDEAVRRIVQSQANYPAFQPALAREYDVIEIRRSWHFDMAIRLY